MKMRNGMILALICAVGLAGYLQDPIPVNFSQHWRLQASLMMNNLVTSSLRTLDDWGICSFTSTLRWLVDLRYSSSSMPESLSFEDRVMAGVPVRVYQRKEHTKVSKPTEKLPTLVYYHGGGWYMGGVNMYHSTLVAVAEQLDIIIILVEYRLAPEHRFPIPLEDCVTVTQYILTNGHLIGVDSTRVAIAGDSAGGNLAAAVALRLRDEKFQPMPKLQLLIYPTLQGMDMALPSMQQNAYGPLVKTYSMGEALSLYAMGSRNLASVISKNEHTTPEVKKAIHTKHLRHGDIPKKYKYHPYQEPRLDFGNATIWSELKDTFENPYFAPLMASDYSGLPNAYIYTAQYDCLRDDGILYAKKLRDAGIDVTHFNGRNSLHGACLMRGYIEGQECEMKFVTYLKNKL